MPPSDQGHNSGKYNGHLCSLLQEECIPEKQQRFAVATALRRKFRLFKAVQVIQLVHPVFQGNEKEI